MNALSLYRTLIYADVARAKRVAVLQRNLFALVEAVAARANEIEIDIRPQSIRHRVLRAKLTAQRRVRADARWRD